MSATGSAVAPHETVRLRPGVWSVRHPRGVSLVSLPDQEPVTADEEVIVRSLADGDHRDEGESAESGPAGALFSRLRRGGWLSVTLHDAGGPIFTVEPRRRPATASYPEPGGRPRLSRFAVVRPDRGGALRITSPRAWADVIVRRPEAAALLADLGGERHVPRLDAAVADRFRRDLLWTGLAVSGDEDHDFPVRQWSATDLAFHRGTRGYATEGGFGATYWGRAHTPPLPARPAPAGPAIDLPRPDLDRLRESDPPFSAVLEARRSVRRHDPQNPITADQLAEFLFRTVRTTRLRTVGDLEIQFRPYPSGGAAHELEVYVVAVQVAGLAAGTYHYDGHDHRLELVRPMDGGGRRLVQGIKEAAPKAAAPQVLLLISARFGRLMWAYEGHVYALILKHVGVLMQTMHLAATAMGLAGCPLGTSAPHAFHQITGVDQLVEDVVGEFLLGTAAGPAGEE